MTAQYPTAVKSFVTKVDLVSDVQAGDINDIQEEVTAIQDTLGALIKTQYIGAFAALSRFRGTGRITHTTGDTITLEATGMVIDNRFCSNSASLTRDLATDIAASTSTTYYVYAVDDLDGTFSLKFRTSAADNFTAERKIGSVHTAASGSPPDIIFALDDDDSAPVIDADGDVTIEGNLILAGVSANIIRDIATSLLVLAGGSTGSNGAHIELYGGSHATLADEAYYDADKHTFRNQNGGDVFLEIEATNITVGETNIIRNVANELLRLAGGNSASNGANIELYGGSHATLLNQAIHDAQIHTFRRQDGDTTEYVKIDFDTISTPPLVVVGDAVDGAAYFNVASDATIISLASAATTEGTISVSGTTVSYNAFCGSHYTQLKDGQEELPVGAVVISTGEIIPSQRTVESEAEVQEAEAIVIVSKQSAIESVDVDVDDKDNIISYDTEYEYDIKTDTEKEISVPVYGRKTVKERRLKAGIGFHKKHKYYSLKPGFELRDGKYYKKIETTDINPDKEYFPYVNTTGIAGDKRVYGVWFGKMRDNAKGMSFGDDNKAVYLVAQVGLFKIRVTDTNGNIENGDYLESSTRPMEGQKQTAPERVNSTIAKAMVDVDWGTETTDHVLGYKWRLIPCVF